MNAQIAVVFSNQMKVIAVFSALLVRLNARQYKPMKAAANIGKNNRNHI